MSVLCAKSIPENIDTVSFFFLLLSIFVKLELTLHHSSLWPLMQISHANSVLALTRRRCSITIDTRLTQLQGNSCRPIRRDTRG